MTRRIVIGDSHIGALKLGSADLPPDAVAGLIFCPLGRGGIASQKFYAVDPETPEVSITAPEWRKFRFPLAGRPGEQTAGDIYFITLPFNTSRFLRDYDWHRFVPWRTKADTIEIPLSDAVLDQIIKGDADNALGFVDQLRQIGLRAVVVDSPRFFADARHIASLRPEVCRALDAAYRAYVGARLQAMGIPVIAQPALTIDTTGATSARYKHPKENDQHHTNAEFGALMVREILAYDTAA